MKSFDHYVFDQVEQADADNAPNDALYKRDGVWRRVRDMPDTHWFKQRWIERFGATWENDQ